MEKLIDFLMRETPNHARELQSDIGLLLSSIDNTQNAVDGMMQSVDDNDYAKLGMYYSMATKLKKIKLRIVEIENCFGALGIDVEEETDDEELVQSGSTQKMSYSDCKVDTTISHGLFENFTYKRPVSFLFEGNRYSVRDWKQLLRIVCEILYQKDKSIFDSFVRDKDMQGSSRTYFAYTDDRMYNGRRVSGSNIYIETNQSANAICSMVGNMLEKYNLPITSIQIFLRSDYTPLHMDDDKVKKN